MQEGFPLRNDIVDRPLNIDMGGDGRYIYWLITISGTVRLVCYDASLLTAANYAGAGTWTVSPFVAQINVTISPRQCVYVASRKEVWAIGDSSIQRVDANPNSATFNTILGSVSHTLGICSAACYVPDYDVVLLSGQNANRIISCRTLSQISTTFPFLLGTTDIGSRGNIQVNTFGHVLIGGSAVSNFGQLQNFNTAPTSFNTYFSLHAGNGVVPLLKYDNLVTRSASVMTFYKYINYQYQRIAALTVTTENTKTRVGYVNRTGKFFMPNSNNIQVVNTLPVIATGTSIAKGFIQTGESACGIIYPCDNDRILIVQASGGSGTFDHFHVIDANAETYIGYVVMTGTYDRLNIAANQFISCKNQIEL